DPTAFAAVASQARALLANQMASPEVVFNQAIAVALGVNNPRRRPQTPATIDQWDLAKSLAFYKARFADASNFTFVFVGSFTPGTIRPLVEAYLASLPATHAHETWRDPGFEKFPRPQYVVRIDWTCDPAQADALVRRVFDEIASLKARPLSATQMAFIHENLLRDFERNSQDNRYFLNEIARRYKNGDT